MLKSETNGAALIMPVYKAGLVLGAWLDNILIGHSKFK
jgi:hypothetical protein